MEGGDTVHDSFLPKSVTDFQRISELASWLLGQCVETSTSPCRQTFYRVFQTHYIFLNLNYLSFRHQEIHPCSALVKKCIHGVITHMIINR